MEGASGVIRASSVQMTMLLIAALVAGCSAEQSNVTVRRLQPVSPGTVRRIAVLPFTEAALGPRSSVPGQEPLPEPPGETVTRAMADAMRRLPHW